MDVEGRREGGGCEVMWGRVGRIGETGSWLGVRGLSRDQGYSVVQSRPVDRACETRGGEWPGWVWCYGCELRVGSAKYGKTAN